MKHFDRLAFGAYVITFIFFLYVILTWKIVAYIFGILLACYLIGLVLDKIGIIKKLKETDDDTQKYDDC